MNNISLRTTLLTASLLLLAGCHGGPAEDPHSAALAEAEAEQQYEEIVISKEQFQANHMKVGAPEKMVFDRVVRCNGNVGLTTSGKTEISSLIPGRVKAIYVTTGDRVEAGARICAIEGNEIIALQQEYAEAAQSLIALASAYERQKALASEEITSQKEFERTTGDYHSMKARVEGLKARLKLVGIDPGQVGNGVIVPGVMITAPFGGVISRQELVLGMNIEPMEMLAEMIDTDKLQVNLEVFQKDIARLKPGQQVDFFNPYDPGTIHHGKIWKIGRSINPATKSIRCIARIDQASGDGLVEGMFVEAGIITEKRDVMAIPQDAAIADHDNHYVLVQSGEKEEGFTFRKILLQAGETQKGYVEVLDPGLDHVLVSGTYLISSTI